MRLRESATVRREGVTSNKLRSALTTLGILIGVAAVIILVAVGTGSSRAVEASIDALGSNTLTVTVDVDRRRRPRGVRRVARRRCSEASSRARRRGPRPRRGS